ncbi:MAG: DUF4097 family beta strand repeat protein, partial [Acidobacteriales bacterium]|nr:DUF4097 family beta strand repeat protein [Terriglobales bacterium]
CAQYWPALIILWGLVKLGEYKRDQNQGFRPRGIGAGGVVLLVVLIIGGLAATQAARLNWSGLGDNIQIDDGDLPFFGHAYTYDESLKQAFPANGSLRVTSDRGAVRVTTSDSDQIEVALHKTIRADSQSEADKWNTQTRPQFSASGDVVTLAGNNHGAGDHWVSVDMEISMPRKGALTIATRHGDVEVTGRDGNLQITNDHGDATASDINGKVDLAIQHGSARLTQIASDVTIEGRLDDVSVEDVKGAVELKGEFSESVKLAKLAKGFSFRSSRSDIEVAKLDGSLELDSGDLRGDDLTGPVRLNTRSKDVVLTGVNGDLRVTDENGSLELRLNKMGSVQVQNRKGDIQLYLPEKAAFEVDAKARDGEVESDFKNLKVENKEDSSAGTVTGSMGQGGPHVVVSNEHGSISIRQGSEAMAPPAPPAPPAAAESAPRLPAPKAKVQPSDN